jgi:hypothetical protein
MVLGLEYRPALVLSAHQIGNVTGAGPQHPRALGGGGGGGGEQRVEHGDHDARERMLIVP